MHVRTYVCRQMSVGMDAGMGVYVCVRGFVYLYAACMDVCLYPAMCMYASVHACMHVTVTVALHIHNDTHIYIYIHTYVYIYTYTYTHIHI